MRKLLMVLNLIISIVLFLISPEEYSRGYCIVALVLYVMAFFIMITVEDKRNYFTFEFIFSVSFFFVFYIFPVFGYVSGGYKYLFNYNANYITKCTALASVGYSAFVTGLLNRTRITIGNYSSNNNSIGVTSYSKTFYVIITLCEVLCFSLTFAQFFVFGANRYLGASDTGIWGYIKLIKGGLTFACLTLIFYRLLHAKQENVFKKSFWYFFLLIIECGIMFFSGYRGAPLGYIIVIISGIALVKKNMPIMKNIVIIIIGLFSMYLLMIYRSGSIANVEFSIYRVSSDLITNNITSFLSYEYVKEHGTVLFPFIGSLLMLVPFLLGFTIRGLGLPSYYVSSAEFLTYVSTGRMAAESVGLGTNIIASIYLSLGWIGVIIFMFILGKIIRSVSHSFKKDVGTLSIYRLFMYFMAMAVAVYQVRADFFYQVCYCLWGYIMLRILIGLCCRTERITLDD